MHTQSVTDEDRTRTLFPEDALKAPASAEIFATVTDNKFSLINSLRYNQKKEGT